MGSSAGDEEAYCDNQAMSRIADEAKQRYVRHERPFMIAIIVIIVIMMHDDDTSGNYCKRPSRQ
jgi:hypothetical protein